MKKFNEKILKFYKQALLLFMSFTICFSNSANSFACCNFVEKIIEDFEKELAENSNDETFCPHHQHHSKNDAKSIDLKLKEAKSSDNHQINQNSSECCIDFFCAKCFSMSSHIDEIYYHNINLYSVEKFLFSDNFLLSSQIKNLYKPPKNYL